MPETYTSGIEQNIEMSCIENIKVDYGINENESAVEKKINIEMRSGQTYDNTLTINNENNLESLPKSLHTLIIEGCSDLRIFPASIARCTSLKVLTITNCKRLTYLNYIESLTSLQVLIIQNCGFVLSLPRNIGNLTSLQVLTLDTCEYMEEFPDSIGNLTSLQVLSIKNCLNLYLFEPSITRCASLRVLTIENCGYIDRLAMVIKELKSLHVLTINTCPGFSVFPDSMSVQVLTIENCVHFNDPTSTVNLMSLQMLSIKNCPIILTLPRSIENSTSLQVLTIENCNLFRDLPVTIGELTSLRILTIQNCEQFYNIPMFTFGNLMSLQVLRIQDCANIYSIPENIGNLTSLQVLRFDRCKQLTKIPENINKLQSLRVFTYTKCPVLVAPENRCYFRQSMCMEEFTIANYSKVPHPQPFQFREPCWKSMQILNIDNFQNLVQIPYINCLTSLRVLTIENCRSLQTLPGTIREMTSLRILKVLGCEELCHRSLIRALGGRNLIQVTIDIIDCKIIRTLHSMQDLQNITVENPNISVPHKRLIGSLYLQDTKKLISLTIPGMNLELIYRQIHARINMTVLYPFPKIDKQPGNERILEHFRSISDGSRRKNIEICKMSANRLVRDKVKDLFPMINAELMSRISDLAAPFRSKIIMSNFPDCGVCNRRYR